MGVPGRGLGVVGLGGGVVPGGGGAAVRIRVRGGFWVGGVGRITDRELRGEADYLVGR